MLDSIQGMKARKRWTTTALKEEILLLGPFTALYACEADKPMESAPAGKVMAALDGSDGNEHGDHFFFEITNSYLDSSLVEETVDGIVIRSELKYYMQTYRHGTIQANDDANKRDVYGILLHAPRYATFLLSNQEDDADIALWGADDLDVSNSFAAVSGKVPIGSSAQAGTGEEEFSVDLGPGTYYLVIDYTSATVNNMLNKYHLSYYVLDKKPYNLSGTANGHESVTLRWDNPVDPTIDRFQIWRRLVLNSRKLELLITINRDVVNGRAQYVDTDVAPYGLYQYRIASVTPTTSSGDWASDKSDYFRVGTLKDPDATDNPPGPTAFYRNNSKAHFAYVDVCGDMPKEMVEVPLAFEVKDRVRVPKRNAGHIKHIYRLCYV